MISGGDPIPTLSEFCITNANDALLDQWHGEKNGSLTPKTLSYGSNRKVWWVCEKGHQWQASAKSRAQGSGCPVCAGKTVLPGDNDLATRHPELAEQWHPTRNGDLTPYDVPAGTAQKVWWRCPKGHEWQANICSRTGDGAGCPVCAGKVILPGENDFASRFPELAREWHPARNGKLTAQTVSPYSNRRVWWVCEKGHAYQSTPAHRAAVGSGCPYCAGRKVLEGFNDLTTTRPDIAEQWHATLNGELSPRQVTAGSHRMVWWQCGLGHVWKAVIYSRTAKRASGCPVCAGKNKVK